MEEMMKKFQDLFDSVAKLQTAEECARLFEDLCTLKELADMSQRLEVARLLKAGKNYREICEATGASTATICRVNKCLMYGKGGYGLVIGEEK
ncbi:MAG: helix-turn-helix domain-containing protein [Clostridia bacterium]|nr:helix-turn-helix domain-containing protein [Clostridia bacterium]